MGPDLLAGVSRYSGGGWFFIRLAGEEADQGDSFFSELVQELEELDEAITALAFPRRESSHTGDRQMLVVRAWRAGTTRFEGGWPDAGVTTAGHTAVASDLGFVLNRGALSGCQDHLRSGELDRRAWLSALAERREKSGDWLAAAQQWRLSSQGGGPWGAYALLRAALATSVLRPDAEEIEADLLSALGQCPSLPEVSLRLARQALHGGDVESALTWAAMADAVPRPSNQVPHLPGTGRWLVSSQMARWLASTSPELAARCAAAALAMSPPPDEARVLLSLRGHRPQEQVSQRVRENHSPSVP